MTDPVPHGRGVLSVSLNGRGWWPWSRPPRFPYRYTWADAARTRMILILPMTALDVCQRLEREAGLADLPGVTVRWDWALTDGRPLTLVSQRVRLEAEDVEMVFEVADR